LNLGIKVIFSKTYSSFLDKAEQVFGEICNSVKETKDGKVIWVPTVIFEVEGGTPKEVIKELYKTSKQMSSDDVQARCFICLSDANAALSMTSGEYFHFKYFLDPDRQEYIWIDDFLESEANNFLDRVGFDKDKGIREKIFKNLGTKPVRLNNLVTSTLKPDDFIEMQIQKDYDKVENCFITDAIYSDVFKEMLNDRNNGVSASILRNFMKHTVEDIAEGPLVKGNHILAFDIEKGKFKFHSNSMREATRRFIETKK
jgi:hypothetical protein